jgi:hypothetical protein
MPMHTHTRARAHTHTLPSTHKSKSVRISETFSVLRSQNLLCVVIVIGRIDLSRKWKIQRIYNFKTASDPKMAECDMHLHQENMKCI